jgi:hypothetical protein
MSQLARTHQRSLCSLAVFGELPGQAQSIDRRRLRPQRDIFSTCARLPRRRGFTRQLCQVGALLDDWQAVDQSHHLPDLRGTGRTFDESDALGDSSEPLVKACLPTLQNRLWLPMFDVCRATRFDLSAQPTLRESVEGAECARGMRRAVRWVSCGKQRREARTVFGIPDDSHARGRRFAGVGRLCAAFRRSQHDHHGQQHAARGRGSDPPSGAAAATPPLELIHSSAASVGQRFSGAGANPRATASVSHPGTRRRAVGAAVAPVSSTPWVRVSASCGRWPCRPSQRLTQKLYWSARASTASPAACSGAMYAGVPTIDVASPRASCRAVAVRGLHARARDPEIGHQHLAALAEQHVPRLEVPVHDAGRVRRDQAAPRLQEPRHHLPPWPRLGVHPVVQRPALDQRHRDVHAARVLADIVHRHDCAVPQLRHRARLRQQAIATLRPRHRRLHDLDRHLALELGVLGPVHPPHPATADELDDLVAAQLGPRRQPAAVARGAARRHPQRHRPTRSSPAQGRSPPARRRSTSTRHYPNQRRRSTRSPPRGSMPHNGSEQEQGGEARGPSAPRAGQGHRRWPDL